MSLPVREPTELRIQRTLTIISGFFTLMWLVILILVLALYPTSVDRSLRVHDIPLLCLGVITLVSISLSIRAQLPARRTPVVEDAEELTSTGETNVIQLTPARNPRLAVVTTSIAALAVLVASPLMTSTAAKLGPEHAKIVTFSYFGVVLLNVVGVILVSVIATDKWRWTYLIAITLTRMPWAFDALGNDPVALRHSIAMGVIAMGFVIAEVHYLRSVASNGDTVLREAADAVIDTAAKTSATAEAARIDGLVHDHILAALLLASRADDPEDAPFIRRSAASALAALSEIFAPEADELDEKEISVPAFAARLIQEVRTEDPTIIATGRGTRPQPIPTEVATALLASTMEAVRNSLRHADGGSGRAITRSVTVHTTRDAVSVVISDDGVGFDQAAATKGRYGVAGSILGRMDRLEGGDAEISSAPGEGTVVRLSWSDPQVPSSKRRTALQQDKLSTYGTVEEQYFAQLDETIMDDVPLGPTVRGMLATLGGLLYLIVTTLDFFDPKWVSPVAAVIFVAGFVIAVLPWLSNPLADPGRGATLIMTVGGPTILAFTLWAWDTNLPLHTNLWTVMLIYLIVILQGFNNYPRAAWFAAITSVVILVTWALLTGNMSELAPEMIIIMLLIPGLANGIQKTTFTMMTKSAALAGQQRQEADLRARELAAAAARRKRGTRVDSLARPLLERLAAGERTTESVRIEAARLEAHLRDDLRARCFRDTDVTRAANEARLAGIRVDLMDDGGLDDASESLRQEVIEAAIEALDGAHEGSVIVRVAPPGRDVVATILTETGSGEDTKTRRLEIHAPATSELAGCHE